MPHHHDVPAEAKGDTTPGPAFVTRRQLRELEAKAARATQTSSAPRIPTATPVDSARRRPSLFDAASPQAAPAKAAPARAANPESAKKASRARRGRAHTPLAQPLEADVVSVRRSTASSIRKRIFSKVATIGAMASVGLILVSTTVPANAFMHAVDTSSVSASLEASEASEVAQAVTVDAVAAPVVARDPFTVVSAAQKLQARSGSRVYTYTSNPLGTIQWPFASGAPITSGFGPRNVAGCGFCSTYHKGLDFTPGSGVPIQIIADGVVSAVIVSNSGLGNHVIVDHVINGQKVQSVYAHMQYGSITVAEGQTVTVGSVVGKVGSTGASTGAHLHFEVHLDGTPVDPFAWLQANAN